jgi:DNA-directed RNA polymerase
MTKDIFDRQLDLEEEMRGMGVARFREEVQASKDNGLESTTSGTLRIMREAFEPLVAGVEAYKEAQKKSAGRHHAAHKFIKDMPADVLSFLSLKVLLDKLSTSRNLPQITLAIGGQLENEMSYLKFKAESPNHYKKVKRDVLKRSHNERHIKTVLKHSAQKDDIELIKLTVKEKHTVGALMLSLIIENTGLVEVYKPPGMKSKNRSHQRRVQPTEKTTEWLKSYNASCELLMPVILPMLVPPKDWTSSHNGGFWSPFVKGSLVRRTNFNYLEDLNGVDMWEVFQSINHLQKTKWKVNREIYNLMTQASDNNFSIGGLPTGDEAVLPPVPLDIATNDTARFQWRKKAAVCYTENIRQRSKFLSLKKKLQVAKKFVDEECMYFVYSLDFRGRVYPAQVYLTPQGDDSTKALLTFAEGKKLDNESGAWLALHGSNLFGFDKATLEARVEWTQEHQEKILECAEAPFDNKWWTEADKPWQFLAFCLEWRDFVADPENFESRLAVALDGSCNGLQNFSAMLRDPIGGRATNLVPLDTPADIYKEVADVVNEKLKASKDPLALPWIGFVSRKLVKRPTMTMPYGATLTGFTKQLLDEILTWKDDGLELPNFEGDGFKECVFLGKMIKDSLAEIVVSASEAMDWLQKVAKIVSEENIPIHWTTPVGFPVLQEYRQACTAQVKTEIAGTFYRTLLKTHDSDKINKRRMAAAISPNFVHSCDASHLIRTVNLAESNDILDLAMVHDSFGTHAADTAKFALLLRHAFVQIHKETDVLQNFYEDIKKQVSDPDSIPKPPKKGTLDIEEVLQSDFFFA